MKDLIAALKLAQVALNTAPRFKVPSLPEQYDNSYKVASAIDAALKAAENKLTPNELHALQHCYDSAHSNGHDFGMVEDVVKGMQRQYKLKPQATGALISSLVKKEIIEVHEPVTTSDGQREYVYTQFTWIDGNGDTAKALIDSNK